MVGMSSNRLFCAMVTSALVNRYPVPYIVGWNGQGKYNVTGPKGNIAKPHLAKRYLDTLPQGGDDDDLVLFLDGHDNLAQIPAEVVIERYFQVAAEAESRLADRLGITIEELHAKGLRQTVFWGADKGCHPPMLAEPQCAEVPYSHLARNRFGPESEKGDPVYNDGRWLNAGFAFGRLGDLRKFVDAGLAQVEESYDAEFRWRNSDQRYLAKVFARQETARATLIKDEASVKMHKETSSTHEGSSAKRSMAIREAEHHATLDYESALVQTGCSNHQWVRKLNYNSSDNTAAMPEDLINLGGHLSPNPIQMPANVYQSLIRTYDLLPEQQAFTSARDWIRNLELETNFVTRHISGFYHATCSKKHLIEDFKRYWFYPFIKPLLRASFHGNQAGQPIADNLIDGRRWEYKISHPGAGVSESSLGGVFTDFQNQSYVSWEDICSDHLDIFDFEIN